MNKKSTQDLILFAQYAAELRLCKHLYLRGNHKLDMFHDKVDKINVWNRVWLSAAATGTQILSLVILDSHLHMNALLKHEKQDSEYMHHFRMSITQYYNRRYGVSGTLGTRSFGRGFLQTIEDLKDCICYHIRNVLHHRIMLNFMNYTFSTARSVFGLSGIDPTDCYTCDTLPENMAHAYLPARAKLPQGWLMTGEGMIVPPPELFRADIVESLFGSRRDYLEVLSRKTTREASDRDSPESCTPAAELRNVQTLDEQITEFINTYSSTPLPAMTDTQRTAALYAVRERFTDVSLRTLERIFGIPSSTIKYRLKKLHRRR